MKKKDKAPTCMPATTACVRGNERQIRIRSSAVDRPCVCILPSGAAKRAAAVGRTHAALLPFCTLEPLSRSSPAFVAFFTAPALSLVLPLALCYGPGDVRCTLAFMLYPSTTKTQLPQCLSPENPLSFWPCHFVGLPWPPSLPTPL